MTTGEGALPYQQLLAREYIRLRGNRRGFSLRAYARFLQLSPATLSQILSGKRPLSRQTAEKVSRRLKLNPASMKMLLDGVLSNEQIKKTLKHQRTRYEPLEMETFEAIADWYHLAILSLIRIKKFSDDPRQIASYLGISKAEARRAIARLKKLNLIQMNSGKFERTKSKFTISSEIGSVAIREFHKQIIAKSQQSLQNDPVHQRDFGAIVIPIDSQLVQKAKEKIQKFRRELEAYLEKNSRDKKQVYCFSMQLFPISKPRGES